MSFKNLIENEKPLNESPVGQKGRTTMADAQSFINDNPHLIDQFKRIVTKMGGKSVASHILTVMNLKQAGAIDESSKETPESYLRSSGYKIREIIPFKGGYTIELYNTSMKKEALEDLKSAGFFQKYNIYLSPEGISVEDL